MAVSQFLLATLAMNTNSESFIEQLTRWTLWVSSKIWKQQHWSKVHRRNVHRRNGLAETASPNCPIPNKTLMLSYRVYDINTALPPNDWKGAWDQHSKSWPITAVRNSVELSFSKLKLIKTFHKTAMTDERLANLAMISVESETAKIWDMTELIKIFASLKTRKKSLL